MPSVWELFNSDLVSAVAGEDLSDYQYCWVKFDTTTDTLTVRLPNSATEEVDGILQNKPESGEEALVAKGGLSKFVGNAALAVGTLVTHEYVSATDTGKSQDASGAYDRARGLVVFSTDAEDDLGTLQILPRNPSKIVASVPFSITANTTVYFGALANMTKKVRITSMAIACNQVPADADGDCTLAVTKYDVSATADKNLLGAATFDLEGIAAAKTAEALSLTATAADLIVDTTDYVFLTVVNDSAALNTADQGLVLTIEGEIIE